MKSYIPFLSLRYLWFHKVSSGLGILGVTLGVGLVLVVVGVMDGFQTRLKNSLLGNTAAVVVRPAYAVDAEALCREIKAKVPGVVEASPIVTAPSLIAPDNRERGSEQPCRVMGIDPVAENRISRLEDKLRRGLTPDSPSSLVESATLEQPFRLSEAERAMNRRQRAEKQGVIVGSRLAVRLGVRTGELVQFFTARRKPGAGGGGRSGELIYEAELFRVTGILTTGDFEVDSMIVLMDRRDALSFFREWMTLDADEVRLLLDDSERCDAVKADIHARADALAAASVKKGGYLGPMPLKVETWKDIHGYVLAAVENERGLLIVITSFSFLVVAFLIGSTQSMLVVEKTREIGVLRALGASVPGTSAVFLGNGFFIGAIGAVAGWGVGTAITSNIQAIADYISRTFGIDLFPQEIYRFSTIPIDVKGGFVLNICLGAMAFALLGSLLPAVRAAMLDPVESLHHE